MEGSLRTIQYVLDEHTYIKMVQVSPRQMVLKLRDVTMTNDIPPILKFSIDKLVHSSPYSQ